MKTFTLILLASLLFIGCKKEDNEQDDMTTQYDGTYSGTFTRTGMSTSNVMLNLEHHQFDGTSDVIKYPAIGGGSFQTSGNTITFVDSTSWTADFDWTLILNGTYNISRVDDMNIKISRVSGSVTDEYMLRKIVR